MNVRRSPTREGRCELLREASSAEGMSRPSLTRTQCHQLRKKESMSATSDDEVAGGSAKSSLLRDPVSWKIRIRATNIGRRILPGRLLYHGSRPVPSDSHRRSRRRSLLCDPRCPGHRSDVPWRAVRRPSGPGVRLPGHFKLRLFSPFRVRAAIASLLQPIPRAAGRTTPKSS
jgi:hypothetical protein